MIKKIMKRNILIPVFILFLTVLTFIFTFGNPLASSAAGTTDIFIETNTYVPVGNTFTFTVRVETDRDSLVHLEITYNGNNLECLSINPSSECTDDGNTIKIVSLAFKTSHKYECVFKVKNESTTTIKAAVIECGSLEGELPTPSLEKTITGYAPTPTPTQAPTPTPTAAPTNTSNATQVATQTPVQTQAPTPTQTPSYTPFNPTADPSATPSNPDEFMDNGVMRYVANDFEEDAVTMPEGFEKRSVKYMGANILGAQNSSGVNLVYTTDILGENGKFFIYIEKQNSLLPYLEIPYGNNSYVFTKFAEIPSSLHEKDFDLAENKIPAYTTINETYKDFIILYGFKVGGELSYYLYDTVEGTLQRCVEPTILDGFNESWKGEDNNTNETNPPSQTPSENTNKPTTAPNDKKDNFKISKSTILIAIIIICVIAVIIAIITIIVRSKKIANKFEDDDDEEYYNEDEFMSARPIPVTTVEETYSEPEETPIQELPELDDDDDEILQLGND